MDVEDELKGKATLTGKFENVYGWRLRCCVAEVEIFTGWTQRIENRRNKGARVSRG